MSAKLRGVADVIGALNLQYPVRRGVDGFCAAGKSTIASAFATMLAAPPLHPRSLSVWQLEAAAEGAEAGVAE